MPAPMPKGEPLTLDFPPPAAGYLRRPHIRGPDADETPIRPARRRTSRRPRRRRSRIGRASRPRRWCRRTTPPLRLRHTSVAMPTDTSSSGSSPYFATAATPTITSIGRASRPSPMVSTYHPTAATPHTSVAMPIDTSANGSSPYFATAATPTISESADVDTGRPDGVDVPRRPPRLRDTSVAMTD